MRRMHAAGVLHNDLAKEPNWLVAPDGRPALVDFQLAMRPRFRGRLFRMLAYDDLRHLLKHKRTYCPESLTARQRAMLARRSPLAALWARTGKPLYRFVTRGLLGWSDREGAGDRSAPRVESLELERRPVAGPEVQVAAAHLLEARRRARRVRRTSAPSSSRSPAGCGTGRCRAGGLGCRTDGAAGRGWRRLCSWKVAMAGAREDRAGHCIAAYARTADQKVRPSSR